MLAWHFALYFRSGAPRRQFFPRIRLSSHVAHRIAASPDHELFFLEITMKPILYACLVALLVAPLGYAAPGGNISGGITGPDGAPFRAAFVRVQNMKTKMTMMVLSDNRGKYSTEKLPAGTYEVWATATGYKSDPTKRPNVTLQEDQTATVDLTMQKASVQWSQLTKYQGGVLLPEGKGKDVVLQQCFNCHAMSKIGVEGRDRDSWLEPIEHRRRVGVH